MGATLSLPEDFSAHGPRIDALLRHSLVASVALFALAMAILLALVRKGRRRTRSEPFAPDAERWFSRAAVMLAAVMLAGLDLPLIARAERDLRTALWAFPHGASVVRVEVMAHRWSWSFRHPGADARFGTPDDVVSLRELRVPLGAPVSLSLTSNDVVHEFYAPGLRLGQDAIPGRYTRAWFRPTRLGAIEVVCAQYCGWAHPTMRAVVRVLPRADFDAWITEESRESQRLYDGGIRRPDTAWSFDP